MDLGDAGYMLLTSEMAEDIIEINKEYEKIIFPTHDYKIKHDQTILLYSLFLMYMAIQRGQERDLLKNHNFIKNYLR